MSSADVYFNETLAKYLAKRMKANELFDLGASPNLQLPNLPRAMVFMPQSVIKKAVNKHCIDLGNLRNLPSAISNPVKIFNSKQDVHSVVLLLDIVDAQVALVCATQYINEPDLGVCYLVKSIHHRPDDQLARWEAEGLLIYAKKS